jgi:hypothetical protein
MRTRPPRRLRGFDRREKPDRGRRRRLRRDDQHTVVAFDDERIDPTGLFRRRSEDMDTRTQRVDHEGGVGLDRRRRAGEQQRCEERRESPTRR